MKHVFVTIGESRCSEFGGNIDEMYCRVSSTMDVAKSRCNPEITWEDDCNELARSLWVQVGVDLWERVVIFKEEVDE